MQGKKRPIRACVVCTANNAKKHRKANWFRYLAQKANTRKRPGSEKLTGEMVEALWIAQGQRCAISKRSLDVNSRWWKPSLDRIDNTIGYTEGNIRIIAWIINHCRGALTNEEFYEMCVASVVNDVPAIGFAVGYWD